MESKPNVDMSFVSIVKVKFKSSDSLSTYIDASLHVVALVAKGEMIDNTTGIGQVPLYRFLGTIMVIMVGAELNLPSCTTKVLTHIVIRRD